MEKNLCYIKWKGLAAQEGDPLASVNLSSSLVSRKA